MKGNDVMSDAMDAGLNGGEKKHRDPKQAKLHRMSVERAHGGYVAHHDEYRHDDGESEHRHPLHGSKHVKVNMAALQEHMKEHMAEEAAEAAAEEKPDGAAPGKAERQ